MGWSRYIARRIVENLLLVLFLAVAMFVLFRLAPGDPVATIVSPELSPAGAAADHGAMGPFRQPVHSIRALSEGVLTLDFGQSFAYRRPVWDILSEKFANTIVLVVPSVTIAAACGLWLGLRAGHVAAAAGPTGYRCGFRPSCAAVPPFWLGILLLMLFAYGLGWFPIGGMRTLGAADQHVRRSLSDTRLPSPPVRCRSSASPSRRCLSRSC